RQRASAISGATGRRRDAAFGWPEPDPAASARLGIALNGPFSPARPGSFRRAPSRPYGYQLAGPLDIGNKPVEGRSSLVLNLEARVKITENIGIVPFVGAGSYYESPAPQLGRTLLYGVGLGFRYHTAFGPLRLHLATPLRPALLRNECVA